MTYLLDTDALSFTSPVSRLAGHQADAWRNWVRLNQDSLFISAITIMEIRFGLERLRGKGATRKSADLAKWLLITETIYRERIVWVSPEIAGRAGELLARAERSGVMPGAEDALVAASAELAGCCLMTRNERHMAAFGVEWMNPLRLPVG